MYILTLIFCSVTTMYNKKRKKPLCVVAVTMKRIYTLITNRKVTLHECKRHTTCCIASTHCAALSPRGVPTLGGEYLSWSGGGCLPWMGVLTLVGTYLPADRGLPFSWVGTPPHQLKGRHPSPVSWKVGTPPIGWKVGTPLSMAGR